jgi:tyrosyl-tRNA synthetase
VRQKRFLAGQLVDRFHGEGAGRAAEGAFDKVFVQHAVPDDIPEVDLSAFLSDGDGEVHLPRLIAGSFGVSSSEARRLLSGGGIKVDGEPLAAEPLDLPAAALAGRVLQVGKRRFAKLSNLD